MRRKREWADPIERALDMGLPEMMGLVPDSKVGKGVGRGQAPEVQTDEDLLHRGWGINEYRQLDFDHMVPAPTLKECKDEAKAAAAGRLPGISIGSEFVAAGARQNISWMGGDAGGAHDGRSAANNRNVSGTGYYGLVSDLNWSPKERVLYRIPPDPQVCLCCARRPSLERS